MFPKQTNKLKQNKKIPATENRAMKWGTRGFQHSPTLPAPSLYHVHPIYQMAFWGEECLDLYKSHRKILVEQIVSSDTTGPVPYLTFLCMSNASSHF